MDYNDYAPAEWVSHWAAMPNSVRALYGIFRRGNKTVEVQIEAWGQLCFDDAANRAIAYHMHNHPRDIPSGYYYVGWRCEMDGPLLGGAKRTGDAPTNFDIYNYVPRR